MAITGNVFGLLYSSFFFSPGAFFSWGLALSYNLVDYACVSILMLFYGQEDRQKHLTEVAILISFHEGLASLSAILFARITDAYKGRFYAILLSTSSYITGLAILWSYAYRENQAKAVKSKTLNVPLFLLTSILLAMGKGATDPLLKPFLSDQLIQHNSGLSQNEEKKTQTVICQNEWLQSARYGAALISIFAFARKKWDQVFAVSSIVMGACLSLFIAGFTCYRSTDQHSQNIWVKLEHSNPETQESDGKVSHVKKMKALLILSCISYNMVLAAGSTFFQEQSDSEKMQSLRLNEKDVIRFSLVMVIKTFVAHITIFIFWLCGAKRQKILLMRIGAGMVCAVICCIIAWKVEVERLSLAKDQRDIPKDYKKLMSVMWLCPQFVFLGLVEGLAQSGLDKLFENESLSNLWRQSKELVSCLGRFMSIPCVLIFRSWFKNFQNNQSHLDRYYLMLAGLSSVFVCVYYFVAVAYAKIMSEDVEEATAVQSATKDPDPIVTLKAMI
ncbi:hypothetical protein L6164_002231 [Bauhinia variegata]|uniref:Uncharacterized protein n=1 Tax=Bauhinia variegata TaxID=167791 RepID=A0ACB9PXQ3_BAUVA|nr:hypothetical protein L6164_002231 [Bauhinia variegata]